MTRRLSCLGALVLATGLAGCGPGGFGIPGVVFGNAVRSGDGAAVARSAIGVPAPHLAAWIERTGGTATLTAVSDNAGVITWLAPSGVTLATRDGMVIGSRGMVPDLLSADVDPVGPAPATVDRIHRYLVQEEVVIRGWRCRRIPGEPEERTYGGTRRTVTAITESCSNATSRFDNHYWLDAGGRVVESRQWLGPETGHLRLVPERG